MSNYLANLPFLPVLIPLVTAILLLMVKKSIHTQKIISTISSIVTLSISGFMLYYTLTTHKILVFCASGWSAPYGIVFTADLTASIMVLFSSILFLICLLFGFFVLHIEQQKNFYYPLWQFLIIGVNGALLTGDLFNLFVFFEIMLIASYILLVIGSSKAQLQETFKYLIINLAGSTLFLIALGALYALTGTMNMADLANKITNLPQQGIATIVVFLLLAVFGLKAAIIPFHFWLPQVHTVAPSPISGIFSGLLIKVGAYAILRTFTLMFTGDTILTNAVLMAIAIVSMVAGAIGAVGAMNYKTILAYHSISQMGYILGGIGLFTVSGVTGSIFFILHHGFIKASLFLTSGIAEKITGTRDLRKMGGLLSTYPGLSFTFLITALSLAGVPPLSGFFGKLFLVSASLENQNYWFMAFAIGTGILTLFSMIKIFLCAYWGENKQEKTPVTGFGQNGLTYRTSLTCCIILMIISIAMGLCAQPMFELASAASQQLMDPTLYIDTVLNTVGTR